MKYPKRFDRDLGATATNPLLGSDVLPTTLSPAAQRGLLGASNMHAATPANINGYPVQRVSVGYFYTGAGVAPDIAATVWIWDGNTERWFKTGSGTLKNATVQWFDAPALCNPPQGVMTGQATGTSGSIDVLVVPEKPGGAPDGTYTFIVGADVSNAP
jgi:hypothetical protein